MELFFEQLANGTVLGATYALIALGYTMVYGIIELINFAHADVFMFGSMIGMQIIVTTGVTADSGLLAKGGIIVVALVPVVLIVRTMGSSKHADVLPS